MLPGTHKQRQRRTETACRHSGTAVSFRYLASDTAGVAEQQVLPHEDVKTGRFADHDTGPAIPFCRGMHHQPGERRHYFCDPG